MECFRAGNKDCVDGADTSVPERPRSPPPPETSEEREWPEYPKTMTRNADGTNVLQKRMERAIYDAIRTGDTHPIVGLIRAGVSPNFKRPAGETCLHAAAYCGEMDLVRDLMRRNSDPTVKDSHGNLPVDLAAMQGKDEVVAFLQPLAPSLTAFTIAAHKRHRHKQQLKQQKQQKEYQEQQQKEYQQQQQLLQQQQEQEQQHSSSSSSIRHLVILNFNLTKCARVFCRSLLSIYGSSINDSRSLFSCSSRHPSLPPITPTVLSPPLLLSFVRKILYSSFSRITSSSPLISRRRSSSNNSPTLEWGSNSNIRL
ncbi:unnamed protein product [Ascophyllum nodosum]